MSMSTNRNEHPEIVDRLSDFLNGDLDPEAHAEVERHLAESGSSNYWLKMVFVGEALKNRTWYLEGRDPNTKFLDF